MLTKDNDFNFTFVYLDLMFSKLLTCTIIKVDSVCPDDLPKCFIKFIVINCS